MDLSPYGIKHKIANRRTLTISLPQIQPLEFISGVFEFPTDSYRVIGKLGEGTYGAAYAVESVRTGARYALKLQVYKDDAQVQNILREAIINLLLQTESGTQRGGPYVPVLYEVAHEPATQSIAMRMELMDGTLGQVLVSQSRAKNDTFLPQALIQIASMLEFFQKRLHMNHRDLKSDNVMIKDGQLKLIDLGFSCLEWNGIHMSGTDLFPSSHLCERAARDLSQLILEILLDFQDELSAPLKTELETLVHFHVDGKSCHLEKYCPHLGMKSWTNAYGFLNDPSVENPHARPAAVRKAMTAFLKRNNKTRKLKH